jgi:trigger factor
VSIDEDAVNKAMDQLQLRASRLDPIEGRNIEHGDTVTLDLERRLVKQPTDSNNDSSTEPEQHRDVSVEIGHLSNPPGFDEELIGLKVGDTSSFTVAFPEDYEVSSFAGAEAAYEIEVKQVRLRVLPVLDDDFAKQAGDFENLAALRAKVETDLNQQAETEAKNDVRQDLLRQLAGRLTTDVPEALILQEIERRVEQLARHMMSQNIDPREANIDWNAFREQQRVAATDAVRSTLMLDAIVSREEVSLTDEDITQEIEHQAEASGRAPSAVRAFIEKDGSIDRLRSGLEREKAIDLLLSRSTIVTA